ncbi:uncharacterized protein LOC129320648 [Prosopis cineraria]|uniref:uncharacterized protein LOC129320648 n=1 Tax=Prosopis cineraria TaxID=364024 RepID=UPI00240F7D4A|nr:uncharacterized protein LOC129320648 [Prosopis cineraria]XP_054822174.1 uncharacterized protein LOC129320648 [Prosopis cineraria]
MGSENLQLCPKSDPLPSKDSGPILLPETEPAPPKEVEQKKKRRRQKKKKKNKGELEGEGVKSNRPNDEHAQQCLEAKPITLEERNQGERKGQVMNKTHDSSVGSRVTHNYNLRSGTGAGILSNEGIAPGPWVPKGPLKDYERYERCLECRQICQRDQQCRRRRYLNNNLEICFFCCANGHTLGRCPMAPGAKCAKGIIMVDDFVKKKCREVTPANVPTPPIVPAPVMSQLLLLCQLLLFGQPIHHS